MDQAELARLLFAVAQQRASLHGQRFGDGADANIRQLAQTGAARVIAQSVSSDALAKAGAEAVAAFQRLVDEMVVASREIHGYAIRYPGVIGEQTFLQAISKLCPLFPIC